MPATSSTACSRPQYDEESARAYARAFLIPGEFQEHPQDKDFDIAETARWLGMPADELQLELDRRAQR